LIITIQSDNEKQLKGYIKKFESQGFITNKFEREESSKTVGFALNKINKFNATVTMVGEGEFK